MQDEAKHAIEEALGERCTDCRDPDDLCRICNAWKHWDNICLVSELDYDCLMLVASVLGSHGVDMSDVPPMCYDDVVGAELSRLKSRIKELELALEKAVGQAP